MCFYRPSPPLCKNDIHVENMSPEHTLCSSAMLIEQELS
eukprot:COSAG04_NODE_10189_length_794_cov_1.335244_2_plen_38_part_01